MNPTGVVGRESSVGNNAMDVRMKQQVLSPRMQDREESNPGSKMFRIGRNFRESFGNRTEQQVVQLDFILQDHTVQLMRQREYDMEVTGCQQFPLSGSNPALACLSLTLWTMTIPA